MRNTLKVAKWEIKRNMKNKSFLIGLFLTPVLFLGFMFAGSLFGDSDSDSENTTHVFIQDNLNIFANLQETVEKQGLNWELEQTDISESSVEGELESRENTAYLFVDNRALEDGTIPVYTSEDINASFMGQVQVLASPIKTMQKIGRAHV